MLVEQRIYTVAPGRLSEYVAHYRENGLAIQKSILGHLVAYYTTRRDERDVVVHMWAYDSMEAREERRARLEADPAWQVYRKTLKGFVESKESWILHPASFSPAPAGAPE